MLSRALTTVVVGSSGKLFEVAAAEEAGGFGKVVERFGGRGLDRRISAFRLVFYLCVFEIFARCLASGDGCKWIQTWPDLGGRDFFNCKRYEEILWIGGDYIDSGNVCKTVLCLIAEQDARGRAGMHKPAVYFGIQGTSPYGYLWASSEVSCKWTSGSALSIGFAAADPAFYSMGYQQESFSFTRTSRNVLCISTAKSNSSVIAA